MHGSDTDSNATTWDTVVVGAGLAGLAAAATAARAHARVLVLEAHRPGGRAAVTEVDGVGFNGGPRALYRGSHGMDVLGGLGLVPRGESPPTTGSRALVDGRLELLPGSAPGLLRTGLLGAADRPAAARLLVALRSRRFDPAPLADRTAAEWIAEVAPRPRVRALLTALVRLATYCADLDRLSADAAAHQVQAATAAGVLYLHGGWQQLVDGLGGVATAAGATLTTSSPVRAVRPDERGTGTWRVDTADGAVRARTVVLAAGGPDVTQRLLGGATDPGATNPGGTDLGGTGLEVTAACHELALSRPATHRFVLGVDRPLYLSTHCPPAELAPPGVSVVHLLRYGARSSAEDRSELEELARLAGIRPRDVVADRFLHRMVVTHGAPLADAGGLPGRPPVAPPALPGLYLAGDWVGPRGLLADAALSSGAEAGRRAAERAAGRGQGTRGWDQVDPVAAG